MKLALVQFFGDCSALVESLVNECPSPLQSTASKVMRHYNGDLSTPFAVALPECSPEGPLCLHITKLLDRPDGSEFDAFGRVISGTLRAGDQVRVLGEQYSLDDPEQSAPATVSRIWITQGRYRVEVNRAIAGNLVLIEGISAHMVKTCTVVSANDASSEHACIFRPLHFHSQSTFKVSFVCAFVEKKLISCWTRLFLFFRLPSNH